MGLSPLNIWNVRRFYNRYHNEDVKLLQLVAVLPWGHNLLLINKVKEPMRKEFILTFNISNDRNFYYFIK